MRKRTYEVALIDVTDEFRHYLRDKDTRWWSWRVTRRGRFIALGNSNSREKAVEAARDAITRHEAPQIVLVTPEKREYV